MKVKFNIDVLDAQPSFTAVDKLCASRSYVLYYILFSNKWYHLVSQKYCHICGIMFCIYIFFLSGQLVTYFYRKISHVFRIFVHKLWWTWHRVMLKKCIGV